MVACRGEGKGGGVVRGGGGGDEGEGAHLRFGVTKLVIKEKQCPCTALR